MRKFGWIATVVVLSFLPTMVDAAGFWPNAEFIAKMEERLKVASLLTIGGPFVSKEIRAGRPFEEGDVAYFGISADASDHFDSGRFLQLEEWRLQADGKLLVTYTLMTESRASRWTWVAGTLTTTWTVELDITSAEVIEKSERAQRLLERGQPVIIGGTEA